MGMPMSSYLLLKTIADGMDNKLLSYSDAIRAIKDFNLYAFILHDPEEDKEFHDTLRKNFDRLDYITGEKLLFFALVDPPGEWLEHGRKREYYRRLYRYETEELLSPHNQIFSKNPGVTALSIANMLKIPYESLPCIVIFSNFKIKEFVWLRTCSEHLEKQLMELGYIAARSSENKLAYTRINTYARESKDYSYDDYYSYYYQRHDFIMDKIKESNLDLCGGNGIQTLKDRIAKVLSDCLSAVVFNASDDTDIQRIAEENRNNFIENLNNEILKFKEGNRDGIDEESIIFFEELCIQLITSLFNNVSYEIKDGDLVIDKKYLERDSYLMLKTAHTVFNDLKGKNINGESEYDFTASAICFSKVFEKEINLSQVHWIRKKLGIELPSYFNRYQPYKKAIYSKGTSSKKIDFNKKDRWSSRWLPPGMGESRICWEDILKTDVPIGWTKDELNDLNNRWWEIAKMRNKSAHSELIGWEMVEKLIKHFEHMEERQYFKLLSEMKQRFRSG